MIERIFAIDREGNQLEFTVIQEAIHEKDYPGVKYKVSRPGQGIRNYFEVQTLDLSADRVMIYMLINHDHPELTGKGIVKAMIKALSAEFKKDIVSSTN